MFIVLTTVKLSNKKSGRGYPPFPYVCVCVCVYIYTYIYIYIYNDCPSNYTVGTNPGFRKESCNKSIKVWKCREKLPLSHGNITKNTIRNSAI